MAKYTHILLLSVSMILFSPDTSVGAERPIGIPDNGQERRQADTTTTARRKKGWIGEVKKFIADNIYVTPDDGRDSERNFVDEAALYRPFNGRKIDTVIFVRNNIFDKGGNFWERSANRLHIVTREKAIARDLLFRPGDKVDAELMVRNLYLLRNRHYLSSADFKITESAADSSAVEITLRTVDNWTISADARISLGGNSGLTIYDENFMGSGDRLSIGTYFNMKEKRYGGNVIAMQSPNLLGTFFNATVTAGKNFDYTYLNLDISKRFINPSDYGGGLLLSSQTAPYDILQFPDSTFRASSKGYDFWLGKSTYMQKLGSSLYFTGRYFNWGYGTRPKVGPRLNPAFHNSHGFLAAAGLYKEKYYTLNRVYGYGIKEVLPAGYNAEITAGYSVGEFWNSWYIGGEYRTGRFFGRGYYLMGAISFGGRISTENRKWQQGALNARVLWFSRMFRTRRSGIRQFVTLNYTRGWSRLEGNNEMVRFTSEVQPRGFTEDVAGLNRAVANLETVVFTGWAPFGFRTVLFGYADTGLIGNKMNVFANDFYTTFGIGARFKNEHLIFQAIQVRLGVAFCKRGYIDSSIFELSNRRALENVTYRPDKPDYVNYR